MYLASSKLLFTVYSDLLNGDSIFAKYFARWYEAIPVMEIIGRNGWSSRVPFTGILFFLAVP